MRLAFTSPDLTNTTLINLATKKPVYEVLSSPPNSAERFTTLRHSPPDKEKERWEGKFVGSIQWGDEQEDQDEQEEGAEVQEGLSDRPNTAKDGKERKEGWIVWAKPEAPRRELSSLLRPVDGKGKLARVFTGYMRADYIWQFRNFMLPHKAPLLQLLPAVSPDPIVTFRPPPGSYLFRSESGHTTDSCRSHRRSFSISRSPSKAQPRKDEEREVTEPGAPHGYLEISPRAIEMLDVVVLTFLIMALSPDTSPGVRRPLSGRLSMRSTPGSARSWPGRKHSAPNSAAVSSGEGTGSLPSTPRDELNDEDEDEVYSPVPVHGGERKGWREMFGWTTPSPTVLANGFEAGMEKLRRFSFPVIGRPRVNP